MGQLNVGYLQGTSNSGFKITLTKESTISHEGDVRFLTSQSYQDLPVYGSKNFLAHKFYPLDLFTPNPDFVFLSDEKPTFNEIIPSSLEVILGIFFLLVLI